MASVHRRFNKANIMALKELGYEIHLLANFNVGDGAESKNDIYQKECEQENLIIHSLSFCRHSFRKNIKLIKEIKKIIADEQFDVIHAHTETGGLLLRLCCSAVRKNCKLIYTPHGMSFYKGSSLKSQILYKPIEKWICKRMDYNLSMNKEEKEWFDKWKPDSSFFVHGVGLDLSRFEGIQSNKNYLFNEFGIPPDSKTIVSVGELDSNKNHTIIIDAISEMKNRENIFYIICGVGSLRDKLEQSAKEKGVNLILAGFRNDVPQIVSSCDAFAFPSFHEGLPVSLMEAMAVGTPAVVSDIRGNVDLIDNNFNGYVVRNDHLLYCQKISVLLRDESLCNLFSNRCVKRVMDYSIGSVQKELKIVYE